MKIGDYVLDMRGGRKHRLTRVDDDPRYPQLLTVDMQSLDGQWLVVNREGKWLVPCKVSESELLPPLTVGQQVLYNHRRYQIVEVAPERSYWLQQVNPETPEGHETIFALREELWSYPTPPAANGV